MAIENGVNLVVAIITSAAVGAVTAAMVNLIGQSLERRSRRDELLLQKAVELAIERVRLTFDVSKVSETSAKLYDPAIKCATYYKWLKHLLNKGKLPPDAVDKN